MPPPEHSPRCGRIFNSNIHHDHMAGSHRRVDSLPHNCHKLLAAVFPRSTGKWKSMPGRSECPILLNQSLRLGGNALWLIPASIGVYLNQNKKTYLLASLALCLRNLPRLLRSILSISLYPICLLHYPSSFIILLNFQSSTFDLRFSIIHAKRSCYILHHYPFPIFALHQHSSANSKANPSSSPPDRADGNFTFPRKEFTSG